MLLFFFNDTPTTEIYTLSLHDALPICKRRHDARARARAPPDRSIRRHGSSPPGEQGGRRSPGGEDRKSTRLNSSHANISYAVFCLKKKKPNTTYAATRPRYREV